MEIHPADAARHGIADGEAVRLFNRRGSCILKAKVTETTLPGVLISNGLWWGDSTCDGKGINQLTPDREADLAGGAVFFSTAVGIEKV